MKTSGFVAKLIGNWVIGITVAALFAGGWWVMNRPVDRDPWEGNIVGLSFSPYRINENPLTNKNPTKEEILADLKLVASIASSVRTYSTTGIDFDIPQLAAKAGLSVTIGAWIGKDKVANRLEIDNLVTLARQNGNVQRVLVGNEAVLRGDISVDELIGYIREAKQRSQMPVSTAEPWHIWLKYPELAREVDFLAVHVLPFWEGIDAAHATQWLLDRYHDLQKAYPGKHIVFTEVGWPSVGLTRKQAVADPVNQGIFLRSFLRTAKAENLDYFIIEAFDQPWKAAQEGGVGAYWGIWDGNREMKPALAGSLVNYANWRKLIAIMTAIGLPFVIWMLRSELDLKNRGRFFLALLGQGGIVLAVWIYAAYSERYLTWFDIGALVMIAPASLFLLGIFLIEGVEMAVNLWLGVSRRRLVPPPPPAQWRWPKVSIHVPAYNEPPAMLIETIKALEKLDYPNYEVLIVDNNTKDPAVWQPVEAYCATLPSHFRFFHLPQWPGFKAGALNFALTETDQAAEIIATIDADYIVTPQWLSELVPHFADPQVALVQAPQDYRDGQDDLFKRMCFWEYAGFFYLGMKSRDEKNAIIQHGTMALIRKSALDKVGHWAQWCITEDAELGLRLFEHGYRAVYTDKSYGQGLMPDSFDAYRKQRYRWAYGAMQILKGHWRQLLPFSRSKLESQQRYQFLAGWLPWIADGLQLAFVAIGIFWSLGMLFLPGQIEPPLTLFLLATLGMFVFKIGKSLWLYASRVPCGPLDNFGAAIAGLALTYAVGKAVWRGFFTSNLPFHRTPKCENQPALIRGLVAAREEAAIAAILTALGTAIAFVRGTWEPAAMLWSILLFVQSLPFYSALVLSVINALHIRLGRMPKPVPLAGVAEKV
ncbi:MAG TPA: glycosyltransferase [Dongiaceae bacterium]|jgi:exo-beta-1,3-glucanase (GH17 family)/cellulose synthase/poly-beta-1,6-N-acetylglucosamine synthase-like glycosyltransferase|nr:glycosyltransferase [Dongiaceae bacterium]